MELVKQDELVVSTIDSLRDLSRVALRMLEQMRFPEGQDAGLYCFRALPEPGGLRRDRMSVRYSLISLLGLFGICGRKLRSTGTWTTAAESLAAIFEKDPGKFSIGELGLMIWLGYEAGGASWIGRALERANSAYQRERGQTNTLELGWLLTGVVHHFTHTGERHPLMDQLVEEICRCYNPETRLFTFQPYRHRRFYSRSSYVQVFGSFASQVYSLTGLSYYLMASPDARVKEIVCNAARRMCELQGPNGEWWWIYDARDGSVAVDYPVYSVHQDGMGPMALLLAMRATGECSHTDAVLKSARYLYDYRDAKTGEQFIDTEAPAIWRAVIRDVPGEDPSEKSFGLSSVEYDGLFERGRISPFRRNPELSGYSFRLLKEARSYCAGWILFAYSQACALYQQPVGLDEETGGLWI